MSETVTTTTETEERVFRVPTFRISDLEKRMERLSRKGAKLGTGAVSWEVVGYEEAWFLRQDALDAAPNPPRSVEVPDTGQNYRVGGLDENGWWVTSHRQYALLKVAGSAPHVEGWRFRGTVVHVSEVGNLLKVVLGSDEGSVPERYRKADPFCEHCRLDRRRKDTFLVENMGTREWKQVGRNCLADFLGGQSPESVASWAEGLASLDFDLSAAEEWGEGGGGPSADMVLNVPRFLGLVAATIERDGWCSKKKAREEYREATAAEALRFYWAATPQDRDETPVVTDAHVTEADEALTWARDLSDEEVGDNDFLWNLKVATDADWVTYRAAGIVAAVFIAKKVRDERALKDAAAREAGAASEWFGEVKKRATYTLTVVFENVFEGYYGATKLVKFSDPDGNVAVSFMTGQDWDWEVGETYTVKATPKAHEEYKGVKQTVLTRVAKV